MHTYNNILKNNIKEAKIKYYTDCFNKYKDNVKNTWQTIKEVLNKTKKKTYFPNYFKLNGSLITDKQMIADNFNRFFVNVGPNSAAQINFSNNAFKDYLQTPCAHKLSFKPVSEETIGKIIDSLKSKTSCGHDGISVKLIKHMKLDINKALTLLINQSFASGFFPDNLKIAKVIPLLKKGDINLIDNYRPISLLPSFSKIFEKVMFNQLHEYFKLHRLYYNHHFTIVVLENHTPLNWHLLN